MGAALPAMSVSFLDVAVSFPLLTSWEPSPGELSVAGVDVDLGIDVSAGFDGGRDVLVSCC